MAAGPESLYCLRSKIEAVFRVPGLSSQDRLQEWRVSARRGNATLYVLSQGRSSPSPPGSSQYGVSWVLLTRGPPAMGSFECGVSLNLSMGLSMAERL